MKTNGDKKNISPKKEVITKCELREKLESKLLTKGIVNPKDATDEQLYNATVQTLKDVMIDNRTEFKKRIKAEKGKKVCYLCMEFLVGRALKNNLLNLGIYDILSEILAEFGSSFDRVYSYDIDPGLGNGGLGRLAACFMDSLTALDYPANGYSLLYDNGFFKQRIVDGEQIELPDEWINRGGVWLVPHPERSFNVKFGGRIEEKYENGRLEYINYDYDEVRAVPYDLMIPGTDSGAVNTIRLWRSKETGEDSKGIKRGLYHDGMARGRLSDTLTKQLYPADHYDEGKLLRLSQQYFLVSASLQSIISDYLADYGSLSGFSSRIAIHINDTHPALVIPELMRILMDVYSYSWDDAWRTVIDTVSYTNHTVLPEALEVWRGDLFSLKLPRIYMIINEINKRFTEDLWNLYPGDWDRISRMSVVAYNQVRMANLAVLGSNSVNGVSKLHSEILRKTVFHDYYKMTPWKFTNVTNGVTHRRWLNYANPTLASLIEELIGDDFTKDANNLSKLEKFKDDNSVLERINATKRYNKESFSYYAYSKTGVRIDPESIFDVQIKRLHEYKRQLLNVLKIIHLYNKLIENPCLDIPSQTFIFGCKAAPGYVMAKKIIKLIWFLSKEIDSNPIVRNKLKILFIEDYNVSSAEILIPSADFSEQISLAGKEASGTGCMKLMMNGAVTVGTLDGANVEIMDAVGKDNIYIFGLNANEVDELQRSGYISSNYYRESDELKAVIDRLNRPIGGEDFKDIADYLVGYGGYKYADPFMCLADFNSYVSVYNKALAEYSNKTGRAKRSLINISKSGIFSSDNSVRNYAKNIWHIKPITKSK